MNYVYIQSEPGLWTVGYYDPEENWEPETDHNSQQEAALRVMFLNGGPTEEEEKEEAPCRWKIAAMAMQGLLSHPTYTWSANIEEMQELSRRSLRCADALIEELEKSEE